MYRNRMKISPPESLDVRAPDKRLSSPKNNETNRLYVGVYKNAVEAPPIIARKGLSRVSHRTKILMPQT